MTRRKHRGDNKTKLSIKTRIKNNPKNINKNKLVNFDPDFTEASSFESGIITGTSV